MTGVLAETITLLEGNTGAYSFALPPGVVPTVLTLTIIDLEDPNYCSIPGYNQLNVLGWAHGNIVAWPIAVSAVQCLHDDLLYERRRALFRWSSGALAGLHEVAMSLWNVKTYPVGAAECGTGDTMPPPPSPDFPVSDFEPPGARPGTTFTLPYAPTIIIVALNGITLAQEPVPTGTGDYSLTGATITTGATVTPSDELRVWIWP